VRFRDDSIILRKISNAEAAAAATRLNLKPQPGIEYV
jgi:hypothetical protein